MASLPSTSANVESAPSGLLEGAPAELRTLWDQALSEMGLPLACVFSDHGARGRFAAIDPVTVE